MNMNAISNSNSFVKTISSQITNSADIEISSVPHKYTNSEITNYSKSSQNIILDENILITRYFDVIKRSCKCKKLSKEDQIKYNCRPEALALDTYQIPGLWYIILKVNSCEDFSEFHDLEYVYLPDAGVISDCLQKAEYILNKQRL